MKRIFLIFSIFLQILNPSSPAAIRPKFQNIQDFQHCLVTYLNTIGIIQFTSSQNDENSAINCDKFHVDLRSSIENMYKLIKLNLYEALGDDGEAECMDEVFRYTKFMEYNVIATAAVQFQPNGFQELKNLLQISKNIFIYATMKCLITNEMISELFQHFAHQIQVDDDQFACVVQHVSENQLMEDFIVQNIDEFLSEKFMESPEEGQAITQNRHENLQQVDKYSIHNSAETATDLIDTNFNESTTTLTQVTNLLEFSQTGSETREANVELNELGSDFNEKEENDGSSEAKSSRFGDVIDETTENLVENKYEGDKTTQYDPTESTKSLALPSMSSTIAPRHDESSLIDIKIDQIYQTIDSDDITSTENILSQTSTILPEIISTKLKKIENHVDQQMFDDDLKLKEIKMDIISENIESEEQRILSDIEIGAIDDQKSKYNFSTVKFSSTDSIVDYSETISTIISSSVTENFDQPPNFKTSTTEHFTMDTTANIDDNFTPTASLLTSTIITDHILTSSEESTAASTQNIRKLTNFSEKFGSLAENLRNSQDSVMAPKKVMILERPTVRNTQKNESANHESESMEQDENSTEKLQNNIEKMSQVAQEFMEPNGKSQYEKMSAESQNLTESISIDNQLQKHSNESSSIESSSDFIDTPVSSTINIEQFIIVSQESSTKSDSEEQLEAEYLEITTKTNHKASKISQEVTELNKNYENISEASKTSETSERSNKFSENERGSLIFENSNKPTESYDDEVKHELDEHKSTSTESIPAVNDDSTEIEEYLKSKEYSDEDEKLAESDDDQVEAFESVSKTTEKTDFTSIEPKESKEASSSYENQMNGKTIKLTENYQNVDENTEQTTVDSKNLQDIIKSEDKKGKIVFKISNLPKDLSKLASQLLNDTNDFTRGNEGGSDYSDSSDEIENDGVIENVLVTIEINENSAKMHENPSDSGDKSITDVNNNSNLNYFETTTSLNNIQENLQQSSEIHQASSESSFQKLAKSLKNIQESKSIDLIIPNSRIQRHISSKHQSCPLIIENLKQKIKMYNLESMDEELNSCMSQLVSPQDIDDYFVFIVLKKYGSTELQANEKNKKLMNLIMSFIGKYIECTDLYGFMEMAGFPQSDDGHY